MAEQYELKFPITVTGSTELKDLADKVRQLEVAAKSAGGSIKSDLADKVQQLGTAANSGSTQLKDLTNNLRQIEEAAKSGFNGASGALGVFDQALASLGGSVSGVTIALAGMAAGAVAVGTLAKVSFDAAVAVGKTAEEQLNLAERTGLTVREVGLYSAAAKVAGVNSGALVTSMRTLSQALSENSEEGKRGKRALAELGIQAHDLLGNVRPMGALWLDIARALGGIEAPAERARIALALFGRGGLELLPLLRGNFRELLAEVDRLGVAFTEQGAKKAAAFDDALDKLGLKWAALKRSFGEKVIGVIEIAFPDFLDPKKGPSSFEQYLQYWWRSTGIPAVAKLNKQIYDYARAAGSLATDAATGLPLPGPDAYRANIPDARERSRRDLIDSALGRLDDSNTLEQKARKAREEFQKLAAELKSSLALDPAVEIAAVQQAKARADGLQRQLEAQKELQGAVRGVEALEKQAYLSTATGLERVIRLREIELSQLGKNAELRERIIQATNLEIGKEIERAQKSAKAEAAKVEQTFERDENRSDRFAGRTFGNALKKSIAEDEKAIKELLRAIEVLDRGEERAIQRRGDKALRIAELSAGLGVGLETTAVERAYQTRLGLARDLYDVAVRRADREIDAEEKLVRFAEARQLREAEIDDARIQREMALLELRKRSLLESRDAAGKVFDTLLAGGGGIRSSISGLVQTTGRTLFQNAFQQFFQSARSALGNLIPGQTRPDGELTGIGKLLHGTVLGVDPLKVATDLNTAATDRNTAAYLGRGGGGGGGGGLGGVISGIPGLGGLSLPAGLFGGASGSSPFVFSAAPALPASPSIFNRPLSDAERSLALSSVTLPSGVTNVPAFNVGRMSNLTRGVGIAGAAAGAAFGAHAGFNQGGIQGDLTGAASILGGAGGIIGLIPALAAATGPLAPILVGVGLAAGIVASFFGDPKKRYIERERRQIEDRRFSDPAGLDILSDNSGAAIDRDRAGNFRRTPVINVTVNVDAMDSKSFIDRRGDITDAIRAGLADGTGNQFMEDMRGRLLPA